MPLPQSAEAARAVLEDGESSGHSTIGYLTLLQASYTGLMHIVVRYTEKVRAYRGNEQQDAPTQEDAQPLIDGTVGIDGLLARIASASRPAYSAEIAEQIHLGKTLRSGYEASASQGIINDDQLRAYINPLAILIGRLEDNAPRVERSAPYPIPSDPTPSR